jgi:hypothetical protein
MLTSSISDLVSVFHNSLAYAIAEVISEILGFNHSGSLKK